MLHTIEITVNGEPFAAKEGDTVHTLQKGFPSCEVVILNGYALAPGDAAFDLPLTPGDSVFFIRRGEMPKKEQLRAMMAARHTPGVQAAVEKGRVAVAGLGGLGSNIALSLARLGIGELLLCDYDVVEPSNLNRQQYYVRHLGLPKTLAMKELIEQVNPFVRVKTANVRLTADNAASILGGYPIVAEALDSAQGKAMLIETLLSQTDAVVVSGSGMAGFGGCNRIRTRRLMSRLYVCGDGETEATPGRGLMAPRVSVCAGHQADAILSLLVQGAVIE